MSTNVAIATCAVSTCHVKLSRAANLQRLARIRAWKIRLRRSSSSQTLTHFASGKRANLPAVTIATNLEGPPSTPGQASTSTNKEHYILIALGVDSDGKKQVLRLREGSVLSEPQATATEGLRHIGETNGRNLLQHAFASLTSARSAAAQSEATAHLGQYKPKGQDHFVAKKKHRIGPSKNKQYRIKP